MSQLLIYVEDQSLALTLALIIVNVSALVGTELLIDSADYFGTTLGAQPGIFLIYHVS
jgi:hypothetical protein